MIEKIQAALEGSKFFYLYLAIWAWVHFRFQKNFWVPEKTGKTVFSKYGDIEERRTGEKVYYIKAIQFFIFSFLTVFGLNIVDSFTVAAAAYVGFLFYFFRPLQTYHWLNGLLVLGMVVERMLHHTGNPIF
jgi:hypothetical protein